MKIVKCDNGNVVVVLKEKEDVSSKVIRPNGVDAAFEKHVPQYQILNDQVEVFVNHVMEENHYIEWIMVDYGNMQMIKHFAPGEGPKFVVPYKDGMVAYSYCNLHSLWINSEIK